MLLQEAMGFYFKIFLKQKMTQDQQQPTSIGQQRILHDSPSNNEPKFLHESISKTSKGYFIS
jgi:hypothetical protein